MPDSAIANVAVDSVLRAAEMPGRIHELAQGRVPATKGRDTLDILESVEQGRRAIDETTERAPTSFTCPECSGSLWEFKAGQILRYRCHAGHAYSEGSLRAHHSDGVEAALWSGLRALEERGTLYRRMAARSRERGFHAQARQDQAEADLADERALALRKLLTSDGPRRQDPVSVGRRRAPAGSGSTRTGARKRTRDRRESPATRPPP
jgi:two-component system chemotaxis response regulator CheB